MGMFQHTVMDKNETRKLLHAINNAQANPLSKEILDKSFDPHWPWLEEKIQAVPQAQGPAKPARSLNDMVEELLALTRALPHFVSAQIGILEAQRTTSVLTNMIRAAGAVPSSTSQDSEDLLSGRYKSMASALPRTEPGQFDPFASEEDSEITAPPSPRHSPERDSRP